MLTHHTLISEAFFKSYLPYSLLRHTSFVTIGGIDNIVIANNVFTYLLEPRLEYLYVGT